MSENKENLKVLIIPDQHAHPQFDNKRFTALGEMILDLRPDEIWNLGDMADLPSLSSYDKGKRSFEGRRYKADVDAVIDAQQKLFAPIEAYNKSQRKNRKATYNPFTVHTWGNHEDRINRVTNLNPELHGTVSVDDLQYAKFWSMVVPFKERAVRHGFAISHYLPAGIMGSPIGGIHAAHNLLIKNGMSCVVGHSHLYDSKIMTRADGSKMLGLAAGCYVHPDMVEGWNKDTAHMWQNGITVLEDVNDGFAEVMSFYSQKYIMERYL